jgi:hypothetical protein
MNEEARKKSLAGDGKKRFLADIERLYLEGVRNDQIAASLDSTPLVVARNLREIKKRWKLAAARQRHVLSLTQCATVYREAMDGWQRSQEPRCTTTEEQKSDDGKIVTRRAEGPGDKAFLMTAVGALKTLRHIAAEEKPDARNVKNGPSDDEIRIALLQVLEQHQVDDLNHEQIQQFRHAIEQRKRELDEQKRELDALRAEVDALRGKPAQGPGDPDGLHAADQARLPGELAPQGPGDDAGPGGVGRLPLPGPAADCGQPHA